MSADDVRIDFELRQPASDAKEHDYRQQATQQAAVDKAPDPESMGGHGDAAQSSAYQGDETDQGPLLEAHLAVESAAGYLTKGRSRKLTVEMRSRLSYLGSSNQTAK